MLKSTIINVRPGKGGQVIRVFPLLKWFDGNDVKLNTVFTSLAIIFKNVGSAGKVVITCNERTTNEMKKLLTDWKDGGEQGDVIMELPESDISRGIYVSGIIPKNSTYEERIECNFEVQHSIVYFVDLEGQGRIIGAAKKKVACANVMAASDELDHVLKGKRGRRKA